MGQETPPGTPPAAEPHKPSFEEKRLGLEKDVEDATGADPSNPVVRAASEVAGVGARYMDSVAALGAPLTVPGADGNPVTWDKMSPGQKGAAVLRRTQATAGAVMGAVGAVQDMLDVGFANLTAPLAAIFPSLPATKMMDLFVGLPHAHSHPPSLIPPAPPIPLPSLGPILFGNSVKVLINGMPAARSGDFGLAPTCCAFTPFFQIKLGSSNVFIGGKRAARVGLDISQACGPPDNPNAPSPATAGAALKMAAAGMKVGLALGALGAAADLAEMATEDDAAMSAAKGLSAAMTAAQLAADLAAAAIAMAMGKDPAIPPVMAGPVLGAITTGSPTVLVGGFPMVNIPNPAQDLLNRLKRFAAKKAAALKDRLSGPKG